MAAGWFTIVVLLLGSVLEAFSTNLPLQTEELWQESSEIRISPSFGLPVVLRTSTSTQTITVQQPGHIQHSTRQTSSVQPVISSTKYPVSKVPEDKQETPDLQTRTTVSLHPTSFSRAVSSSSRPSRPSTSRRDHDNAIFGVLSIVREPVPEPPPTTIFKTKQDPTASRFVSVDLTSKSNLIPEFRTSIMDTMTLIANLNVDPSSPSTSGALVFDLETSSLDSFENITSTSKKSTWAVSHHSMSDSDPRMGVGTDQDTAGTATVPLSPPKGDSPPQSSTWCTYRPLFQYQTPADATVSETWKATPIIYPQPLLIMPTYTKPLDTPLSSARVLLYHSGEQPMGTNEAKGNYIGLIDSDHLDSLSEGSLPRYRISIPSPDRENNRLTGSDNPQPSVTFNSSSMASVTTWSDAGLVDHQTASTTLDVSNGPSRTPKSTDTGTATSVRSGSVIDGLRRARTISRRSLGMSVSAAVGGTTIFLLIFALHRPIYRWICRRRTGVIWIGHASAANRSHHTELRSPPMQYPEMSHFSDDSEADYTKSHRA